MKIPIANIKNAEYGVAIVGVGDSKLFYWDYVIGILAFSLLLGFTLGSKGDTGRGFVEDLKQISMANYASAFTGGVIFNLSNILLSASVSMAGLSVTCRLSVM